MQTLELSDSTPRTPESRLKSLFWPSIQSGADVDYLAVQGFWVCIVIAVLSVAVLAVNGHPGSGGLVLLYFYLGGIGVRERSRFSAVAVLLFFALDTVVSLRVLIFSPGALVVRTIITALLLSNLRATWINSRWKPGSEEAAPPPRLGDTLADRFSDQWPAWVWPKVRVLYYVFVAGYLLLTALGLRVISLRARTVQLERQAYSALQARNFKQAAELYEALPQASFRRPEVWNALGAAYLGEHEPDKAIHAYRQAIALDPHNDRAWGGLSRTYFEKRKYEEAIAGYRKELEINPFDEEAESNLGHSLLRLHRYPEAVTELENAYTLASKDTRILERLGEAYLRNGQTDKALEKFNQALRIAANPPMWNGIAYRLADTGQRLDLARHYAELSVAAAESELRDVAQKQPGRDGAALSSRLASYWDTLGWVYFHQRDLKKAERYLAAAWRHAEFSAAAYHLGQLYEAKGDRQKAITMYAKAASVADQAPEAMPRLRELVGDAAERLALEQQAALAATHTHQLAWPAVQGTGEVELVIDATGAVARADFLAAPAPISAHTAELGKLRFSLPFPDSATSAFVHRAEVDCGPSAGCRLILAHGDEAAP
jgi:tetratricopeptide (TPR) repeat protein